MIDIIKKAGIILLTISLFSILPTENLTAKTITIDTPLYSNPQTEPPTEFAADATPEEILASIEAYYRSLSITRAEEKWGESEIVYDGKGDNLWK